MQKPDARGLTLIELMVTIALLVIIIGIGMPSFEGVINGIRLSSTSNELTAALHLARSEAIRRNRSVVLCRSVDLAACTAVGDEWRAWIVFVDTNGDGAVGAGEEVVKSGTIDESLTVRASAAISSLGQTITFMSNGIARGADESVLLNATLATCVPSTRPALNVRAVQIGFGGRTTVRGQNTAGDCSTAPNDT